MVAYYPKELKKTKPSPWDTTTNRNFFNQYTNPLEEQLRTEIEYYSTLHQQLIEERGAF